MSSKPKDYASGIARMRKLENDQRHIRQALRESWIAPGADPARCRIGSPAQAVLQRELSRNARLLTHMHVALAFCRGRYRRDHGYVSMPKPTSYAVANWIGILSKGTGWTNLDAVMSQYQAWACWCNGSGTEYKPVAWQREFLRRERKLKRARRDARRSAQGRVPAEVAKPRPMPIEQVAALFPEPNP